VSHLKILGQLRRVIVREFVDSMRKHSIEPCFSFAGAS
jgi:hypothetical protein